MSIYLLSIGLRVLYDLSRPDGQKVAGLCVRSQRNHVTYYEPIAADHVYRVVVPSFIIRGGDGYTMVKQNALKHELFGTIFLNNNIVRCCACFVFRFFVHMLSGGSCMGGLCHYSCGD